MNHKLIALIVSVALGGAEVDQGQSGKKGPWAKTTLATTNVSTTFSVLNFHPPDGGPCVNPNDVGCTVVFQSLDLLKYKDVTATIISLNQPMGSALIEWSPDGSNWQAVNTLVNVANTGTISVHYSEQSRRFLRVEVGMPTGDNISIYVTVRN